MTNVENNQAGILFLKRDKPSKVLSRKILDFFRKSDKKAETRSLGAAEESAIHGFEYSTEDYQNSRTEFVTHGDNSYHEKGSIDGDQPSIPMHQLKEYLWKYVILNDRQGIISTLQHGADVNAKFGEYGQTVLHEAGRRGFHKTCELLVRAGADPNEQDDMGFIPLHLAVQFGRKEAVKSLLRYCSSVEIKNIYGDAAIHIASRFDQKSLIPIILEKPLSTPLYHLNDKKSKSAPDLRKIQGQHSPLNELLRRDRVKFTGIPSSSNSSSSTSLSDTDMTFECCHHRVDLRNENGDTGLHIASALNHKSTAKKLLQYGASTNIRNDQGFTPLELAVSKNNGSMIRLLRNPPKVIMLFNDTHENNVRVGHRQTLTLPKDVVIKRDCKPGCGITRDQSIYSSQEDVTDSKNSTWYVNRSTSPMFSASSDSSVCSCYKERSASHIITSESDRSLTLEERIRRSLYGSSTGSQSEIVKKESSDYSEKDRDFSFQTVHPPILQSTIFDPSERTRIVEIDPQPNNTYDDSSSDTMSISIAKHSSLGSTESQKHCSCEADRKSSTFSTDNDLIAQELIFCSTCSRPFFIKPDSNNTIHKSLRHCPQCKSSPELKEQKTYLCKQCCCSRSNLALLNTSHSKNGSSSAESVNSNCESLKCTRCQCHKCHHCTTIEEEQLCPTHLNRSCACHSGKNIDCKKIESASASLFKEETTFSISKSSKMMSKEDGSFEHRPSLGHSPRKHVMILEEQTKTQTTHYKCCHHCSNCHHPLIEISSPTKKGSSSSSSNNSKTNLEVDDEANKVSTELNDRIQILGESIREKLQLLNTKYAQLESQEDKLKKIITEKNEIQTRMREMPTFKQSEDSYILPGSQERGIDIFMDDYSKKKIDESNVLDPPNLHVSPKIKELQDQIQKSYL